MDGIIIVDKEKNYTSHDVVNIARKSLKTKRVGHIGTLDPNATGVLVLCVNRATKLVKFFENHSKTYIATIQLGVKTDTDDLTGKVIETGNFETITESMIRDTLDTFLGKQLQVPPKYSAIKVNGKKLYDLARRDIVIPDIKPREIEVFDIKNFTMIDSHIFTVELHVSKGTYIRSIARDLGEKLGCFGTLKELRRTTIETFTIDEAISIEDLKAGNLEVKNPFQYLNMQRITIDDRYRFYIENGRFLDLDLFPKKENTIITSTTGEVLAIYHYDETKNKMRMSVKWC